MKKVIMLAMALTMCAGAAMADHIAMFGDLTTFQNCFRPTWNPTGSNFVYVVQKFNAGSSANEFKVENLANAPFSSFSVPTGSGINFIGDPMGGISLAFPACINTADYYCLRMNFADDDESGAAPDPCGKLQVVPDPTAVPPVLQTVDCLGFVEPATGGSFYFGTGCGGCGEPVATEKATWGSIKALYR